MRVQCICMSQIGLFEFMTSDCELGAHRSLYVRLPGDVYPGCPALVNGVYVEDGLLHNWYVLHPVLQYFSLLDWLHGASLSLLICTSPEVLPCLSLWLLMPVWPHLLHPVTACLTDYSLQGGRSIRNVGANSVCRPVLPCCFSRFSWLAWSGDALHLNSSCGPV